MDISAINDPQFNADMDYAAKRYAAHVVGELLAEQPDLASSELHQLLLEQAAQAEEAARS